MLKYKALLIIAGGCAIALPLEAQSKSETAASRSNRAASIQGQNTAIHVVRKGETLWSISRKFGSTPAIVKQLNGLRSDKVLIGQRLTVPRGSLPTTPVSLKNHKVLRGENLYRIARKYRTTPENLQQINRLKDPRSIMIGQILKVPNTTPVVAKKRASASRPSPKKSSVRKAPPRKKPVTRTSSTKPIASRTVQKKPTTTKRYPNTPNVKSSKTVSKPPKADQEDSGHGLYTVMEGDTLESIAKTYSTELPELRRINGFSRNRQVSPGDLVTVPSQGYYVPFISDPSPQGQTLSGPPSTAKRKAPDQPTASYPEPTMTYSDKNKLASTPVISRSSQQVTYHQVRIGDSLKKIAAEYGTSPEQIMLTNSLRSESDMKIGDEIKIPLR